MNTAPLPKEITDRIKKEGDNYSGYSTIIKHYVNGRLDEATRTQSLVEALESAYDALRLFGDRENSMICQYIKTTLTEYNKQP